MDLISVAFEHDLAFSATVRGHRISLDVPGQPGFIDSGPSPVELFVMAIGGCIGMHMALFCAEAGLSPAGLRVDLSYTLAVGNGRKRVSSVYAEVDAPGVPADLASRAEEAVRLCILSNTLTKIPELDILVRTGPGPNEAA
jgi:uncharacterized OsmC-like protein